MQIYTALALAAAYASRYPQGTVDLSASEETVDLKAQAVRTYNPLSGPLVWVKATTNFLEAGELVAKGDFVEVREKVAVWLTTQKRAVVVTQEEVDAATKAAGKKAA